MNIYKTIIGINGIIGILAISVHTFIEPLPDKVYIISYLAMYSLLIIAALEKK